MAQETMKKGTLNGVDVDRMFATIEAVSEQPEIGRFVFRAENRWLTGGHNRSRIAGFFGAGREDDSRREPFVLDNDEPDVLLGSDQGANPVEYLLHALAGCLTTSIVYHAAARGIRVDGIESKLDGDLDLRGMLGLPGAKRNGYEALRVHLRIDADVPDEQIEELARLGQDHSPVYDTLARSVPITVTAERMS